jgi:Arc/MetJ-type ribon-helix-helix transcriptional regulator
MVPLNQGETAMPQQKVTLDPEITAELTRVVGSLGYRSKSAFIRAAIEEKLQSERQRLRQALRNRAYEMCASEAPTAFWGALEGEDFDQR